MDVCSFKTSEMPWKDRTVFGPGVRWTSVSAPIRNSPIVVFPDMPLHEARTRRGPG